MSYYKFLAFLIALLLVSLFIPRDAEAQGGQNGCISPTRPFNDPNGGPSWGRGCFVTQTTMHVQCNNGKVFFAEISESGTAFTNWQTNCTSKPVGRGSGSATSILTSKNGAANCLREQRANQGQGDTRYKYVNSCGFDVYGLVCLLERGTGWECSDVPPQWDRAVAEFDSYNTAEWKVFACRTNDSSCTAHIKCLKQASAAWDWGVAIPNLQAGFARCGLNWKTN